MPSDVRAAVRDALIVVIAFAAAGAVAGWAWHAIWAPAPDATGYVIASGKPVFPAESYIRASGLYVLLAGGVGCLLGAGLAFVLDRDEVATLAGVLLGSLVGGRVMAEVGHRLGPDDPPTKVTTNEQLADVVASLDVEPLLIWTTMPAAAVGGVFVVYLMFAKRRTHVRSAG